jgi:hypothetical protein
MLSPFNRATSQSITSIKIWSKMKISLPAICHIIVTIHVYGSAGQALHYSIQVWVHTVPVARLWAIKAEHYTRSMKMLWITKMRAKCEDLCTKKKYFWNIKQTVANWPDTGVQHVFHLHPVFCTQRLSSKSRVHFLSGFCRTDCSN